MNQKTMLFIGVLAVFALLFGPAAPLLADQFAVGHIDPSLFPALAFAGIGDIQDISKKIEGIENSLKEFADKAKGEIENSGKIATETANALEKLGEKQKEIADRLLAIEQKGGETESTAGPQSWGHQFTNSAAYKSFAAGDTTRARFEVQNNTVTGSDTTVAPDRKPGVVPGAFQPLTLESVLPSVPTSSNAIEYTREASFVNNAAEVAEAAQKPESDITFALVNMPVATVAHWIKISKQLAADNAALAAYINNRMVYGVNRKVETQLAVGNGTSPNLSGLFKTGNFTAHGYSAAQLGSTLEKFVLIRKIIADLYVAGYPADSILLNPIDWAQMDIELLTTPAMQARISVDQAGNTRLWGIPVIQAVGVAQDTFLVGSLAQACTKYDRQGVTVDLSEHDADNFTKNLITLRAERRLALTVEVPAALRGGDLTP